jgi:hypothetical protein
VINSHHILEAAEYLKGLVEDENITDEELEKLVGFGSTAFEEFVTHMDAEHDVVTPQSDVDALVVGFTLGVMAAQFADVEED